MKNNRIQFWRIVMTYVVATYHLIKYYGIYTSGYIVVEFFFVVLGYLMAYKFYKLKKRGERLSAWNYFIGKYTGYWPYSATAFMIAFVSVGFYHRYSIKEYVSSFITHLPELFLVNMVGFESGGGVSYNDISWYLSVLLILSLAIWFLLNINDRIYARIVVPISIIGIYLFFVCEYGTLSVHEQIIFPFVTAGMMRGFAGLNMGIASYFFADWLSDKKFHTGIVSTVLLLGAGGVLPLFFYQSRNDFLMAALLFFGVALAFGCDDNSIFDNKVISWWADIAFVIYLNHEVLTVVTKKIFSELNIWVFLVWFAGITVFSLMIYVLVRKLLEILLCELPVGRASEDNRYK